MKQAAAAEAAEAAEAFAVPDARCRTLQFSFSPCPHNEFSWRPFPFAREVL